MRLFNQTAAECTNLYTVLHAVEPPAARAYLLARVLPFELDVLHAKLKYWAGDHLAYLDALAALLREHCVPFLDGILAHRASRGSRAATLLLSVFQKGYAMRRKRMQPVPRIALDELEWTGAVDSSFDSEVGLDTLCNLVGESVTLGTISFRP